MRHRLLIAGIALVGFAAGSVFAAPETKPSGEAKTKAEAKACEGCEKASSEKGKVGYCEHCGACVVKISADNAKKGVEALEKAGYKGAKCHGGLLCVKVEKKDLENVQKALEGLL